MQGQIINFNPRSREGSDKQLELGQYIVKISIHAPARGATQFVPDKCVLFQISIHAPARGATTNHVAIKDYQQDFNPRSREGSDYAVSFLSALLKRFQSTLPRGERRYILQDFLFPLLYFNPRSREGSDVKPDTEYFQSADFNPRSREGSDHMQVGSGVYDTNFNPRSREGSDAFTPRNRRLKRNFNPRSREGSDCAESQKLHGI